MTEQEAKTKWCPFVRFAGKNAVTGGNRLLRDNSQDITTSRCIGSDCMAWRRKSTDVYIDITHDGSVKTVDKERGYCGLVGAP